MNSPLVSVEWLESNLGSGDVILLDASVMPVGQSKPQDSQPEYIKGALIFDIENDFSVRSSNLPHTLLTPSDFQTKAQFLGVNQNSTLIIYDSIGVYSAARAWWNFKLMGHTEVFVLNGGLKAWKEKGLATVPEAALPSQPENFTVSFNPQLVVNKTDVLNAIHQPQTHIIDLRSQGRFYGKSPEPRPGLRGGHIPTSINIPYDTLHDGIFLKENDVLKNIFLPLEPDDNIRLVFSCGSGLTACIGILAAYCCGFTQLKLYDGSWSEWGADDNLPVTIE